MSQSLYMTLQQQHPNAIIDVIAPGWCKPILERMPQVNRAIEMPLGHGDFNLLGRREIGKSLREEQYDQAITLPRSAKSALIPWFANIPKRTGWKGETRYILLNDLRANMKDFQYMVERYVALAYPKQEMLNSSSLGGVYSLPKPQLSTDKQAQQTALQKFQLTQEREIIGMCPGAEFGPTKKWPESHYAETANTLINAGKQVWLFGSQKDHPACTAIRSQVSESNQQHVHILAGQTSLIEAVDLLAMCRIVISNDSGLMHVAAAVDCNVVAIYGSTSPQYTPPLSDKVQIVQTDIECRPCFKKQCQFKHLKCLTQLSPKQVLNAVEAFNPERIPVDNQ